MPTSVTLPTASSLSLEICSCARSRPSLICESVTWSGPVRSQSRICSTPSVTCLERSPTPDATWLLTKVTISAMTPMPASTTMPEARLRDSPRRTIQLTTGADQGRDQQGDHDRQHDDHEELEQPQDREPGDGDDDEPPGPGRGEVHAVGHLGGLEVRLATEDRRDRLRGPAAGPHLGPLQRDPLAQLEALALGLGIASGARAGPEVADQLAGISSHVDRLRASAAAAAGRLSERSPTAAST